MKDKQLSSSTPSKPSKLKYNVVETPIRGHDVSCKYIYIFILYIIIEIIKLLILVLILYNNNNNPNNNNNL